MKTVTTLIAGVALATASAVVNATDVQPTPVFTPFTPFAMTEDQQTAIAQHQRLIAEQQRAFAEQQAAAARDAMEAQRRFAEQMAATSAVAPAPCIGPGAPFTPFAMPEMPEAPQPFERTELPAAPSVAGLNPESRRTEMRKFMEERRKTVRKRMRAQRDAAVQERGRYLEQIGRITPEV